METSYEVVPKNKPQWILNTLFLFLYHIQTSHEDEFFLNIPIYIEPFPFPIFIVFYTRENFSNEFLFLDQKCDIQNVARESLSYHYFLKEKFAFSNDRKFAIKKGEH